MLPLDKPFAFQNPDVSCSPEQATRSRLGLHYFNDSYHYRQTDLDRWLPVLRQMGVSWLCLSASTELAIPEPFIRGLIGVGIEPVLHFKVRPETPIQFETWQLLLESYAHWGINYITIFDQPNCKQSWSPEGWIQPDLVERFLDIYQPLAEMICHAGLIPVFPPLQPGSDYWDTSFLYASLQGLHRRDSSALLSSMVIGAYAHTSPYGLDWGAGGPDHWPDARPYLAPPDQQDQRGFFICDWYASIAQAALGQALPIIMFEAGRKNVYPENDGQDIAGVTDIIHEIGGLVELTTRSNDQTTVNTIAGNLPSLSSSVLAVHFWQLAAEAEQTASTNAWFFTDGRPTTLGMALQRLANATLPQTTIAKQTSSSTPAIIAHYLLIARQEWAAAGWLMETIRPFLLRVHPTIGFSLDEAALAQRVTVIGDEECFSEAELSRLSESGCMVRRIQGDGTSIATQLADE